MARTPIHKDRYQYKKLLDFQRARAQAEFRGEPWQLTEDEYRKIWNDDRYNRRGRAVEKLCLTRIDSHGPWAKGNIAVMSRQLHFTIKSHRFHKLPYEDLYKQAEYIY